MSRRLRAPSGPAARVLEQVRAQNLLSAGRPVLVMLSGGRDSSALLDLAVQIAGARSVSALHVNYGLRPEADIDERHCRALCEGSDVPLHVRTPRRAAGAAGNLQAWARAERYGAAVVLMQEAEGDTDIAAGHTSSDQLETILYRLASSPSRRAILGMAPREGRLVRPLLRFTRAQVTEYCLARGLSWREDASNASGDYARNRVRHDLVPALTGIHPAAEANLLALVDRLRDEGAVLDELVEGVLQGNHEISLSRLRALAPGLRGLVLQRLADRAAGGTAAGVARRAGEVAALSERGTTGLDLGSGVRAVVRYGVLSCESPTGHGLQSEPAGDDLSGPDSVPLSIPGAARLGAVEIRCELGMPELLPGVLDRDRLAPTLTLRRWRAGDRMAPLGLGGTKSLQDLFTARRVPRDDRHRVPVVESAGEIAWVAGVATSEAFKVTAQTREAVRLSASAGTRTRTSASASADKL